jgi:alpha-beta hydrolase superfamily lysophospholipase
MILVSRTYWGGMPFWFRKKPDAHVESLVLRTEDLRQIRGLYWSKRQETKPRVGVVIMHPRVDFTHHYAVPRLVDAGFAVVAANTRWFGNETMAEHEDMVTDLAACVTHLREKRGVAKVVVLGNCGGASLGAYYQAEKQAEKKGADGVMWIAAHRGQGKVLQACIDPSVVDENDVLSVDPALDMYDAKNGFAEPPAPSTYDEGFLARYRAAQRERVARIDARARELLARREAAADLTRAKAAETVMVVYRTMANPAFVDPSIDPSPRDYGSLLSERPDLMNYAALGLARTVTPRAWLSTWSGLSSKADMVANVARISPETPTLMVHAGRDREVFPADVKAISDAIIAKDKTLVTVEGARHYFEPDFGEKETPHVEKLMDVVVPWIEERFA